jgi:CRISPR-associated endonuclease Csy4
MDYYFDVTLKPDAEMSGSRLTNMVYTKFHKALHDLAANNIGISFPNYKILLGNIIRVHGTNDNLTTLVELDWLSGIIRYCTVSGIRNIPPEAKHRTVSRKQTTMNPSALRRLIKRGSITDGATKNYSTKMFERGLNNPFVELVSGSNGHKHRRYIQFGELHLEPVSGKFDYFGLSKTATVPWF